MPIRSARRIVTPKARTITIVILLLLAVGIGAAYLFTRLTPSSPDSTPPEGTGPVETETSPASEPSETASDPSAPPSGDPRSTWSTPVWPECGAVIAPSDLDSTLEFSEPPERLSSEDPFPVTVGNTSEEPVVTEVDRYDFAVPVLTDDSGEVLAMGSLEPVLAEGYSVLAVAPEDELLASGTLRWTTVCGEETGSEEEPAPLPEGDYQMFLFATTGPFDDPEDANQIQGGPFPITVDAGATHEPEFTMITGGSALPECGHPWPAQIDPPGTITLASGAADAALGGGQVEGALSLPGPVSGANVYADVLIIDDGEIVGPRPHASDNLIGWYASADLDADLAGIFDPSTCEGEPLPAGEYEAVLTVRTIDSDESTIAVSELFGFSVGD